MPSGQFRRLAQAFCIAALVAASPTTSASSGASHRAHEASPTNRRSAAAGFGILHDGIERGDRLVQTPALLSQLFAM
jgi:hypothetical protein